MPKIFISYRRADSKQFSHTVYLLMRQRFGVENVFLDVDDIPVGVDFRKYLANEIAKVDVVLVMIGQQWGEMMRERANEASDFVRIEVESALKQGKIVIPVLLMDAVMPDFKTLPQSIEGLQWINASIVRELPDMERDCERLANGIEEALKQNRYPLKVQHLVPKVDESILPDPFEWIHIPAGNVTIEGAEGSYIPAGQSKNFSVDDFYIAKYPITNAQYAIYVAETGRRSKYDNKANFNQPLQPVVGLGWYGAIAYCQWLSDKLGYAITLPTEQQWQRAAQGDDKRIYPWGNKGEAARCNNNMRMLIDLDKAVKFPPNITEKFQGANLSTKAWQVVMFTNPKITIREIMKAMELRENEMKELIISMYQADLLELPYKRIPVKTSLVNQYPTGASPYGVMDMVGNVREWCLTEWQSGSQSPNERNTPHVLRGGTWLSNSSIARTNTRGFNSVFDEFDYYGFRICVASAQAVI